MWSPQRTPRERARGARSRSVTRRPPSSACTTWTTASATSLSGVSCASARLCTALDQAGNVVLSTDLAADPRDWIFAYAETPDFASGLTAVGLHERAVLLRYGQLGQLPGIGEAGGRSVA